MKLLTLRNWRRCAWTQISALLSLFSFWGRLSNARSDLQRRLSFPVSVSPQFSHSSVLFSAWATTLINREWINQLLRIETLIRLIPLATVAYLRSFDRFRRKFTRYLEGFFKTSNNFFAIFFFKICNSCSRFLNAFDSLSPRPSRSTLFHWWGTRRLWDLQLRWAEPNSTTKCLFNYLEYWRTLIRCKKRSSAICRTPMNSGSKLSYDQLSIRVYYWSENRFFDMTR